MSQSAVTNSVESFEVPLEESVSPEFTYRPIPVLAPVTLILGLMSSFSLLAVPGLPLGLLGTILGTIALFKIRRSDGELGGMKTAAIGAGLSVMFLTSGTALHAYNYATEVPEGYQRVNFTHDISEKEFTVRNGQKAIPAEVESFNDRKIFIKGYMYPTRQTEGLSGFLLVKDSGECCFGGEPKENDMIMVMLADGKTVDYMEGLVAVAGTFRTEAARGPAQLTPVYSMDGDSAVQAKSSF